MLSAGRLSSATIGTATTTWGTDANGNRTTENGVTIASYDNQDRLNTWKGNSYQYNPAGDLSAKTMPAGTTHYSYDNQGGLRQVKLASGNTIDYAIDPAGRRTGKRVNGQLQWQLVWLNNLRPIAKLKADNTLEATYYYGDKPNVPEAMDKGGKTYRIVSDHNGSVRLVIDANSGEVAQQMDYDVWGQVINDTNPGFQPFGFAGGLYDPDTQLTRFGARDYDAETGRWTAKDPILFDGGDSNLYGYVLGDPVNLIDPAGLDASCGCKNPYQKGSTQYWIYEWAGTTKNIEFAVGKAATEKMNPGPDADNRTAAEHYLYAMALGEQARSGELGQSTSINDVAWGRFYQVTGFSWGAMYQALKSQLSDTMRTSPASLEQLKWETLGWWDQFSDNFNKTIKLDFGVCQ